MSAAIDVWHGSAGSAARTPAAQARDRASRSRPDRPARDQRESHSSTGARTSSICCGTCSTSVRRMRPGGSGWPRRCAAADADRGAGRAGASADRGRVRCRGRSRRGRPAIVVTPWTGCPPACSMTRIRRWRQVLLDFAREHDPDTLARHAHGMSATFDQDGTFRDLERAAQRREFTLHRRADGSGTVTGELTSECAELVATMLDTLAKPTPDAETAPGICAPRRTGATTGCWPGCGCCSAPAAPQPAAAPPPWCCDGRGRRLRHRYRCRSHRARLRRPDPRREAAGSTRKPERSWCCCPRRRGIEAYSSTQPVVHRTTTPGDVRQGQRLLLLGL